MRNGGKLNHDGQWWRPGMDWFKPKLMKCATCDNNFYQRAHTRRKYCDECKALIERRKIQRLRNKGEDK